LPASLFIDGSAIIALAAATLQAPCSTGTGAGNALLPEIDHQILGVIQKSAARILKRSSPRMRDDPGAISLRLGVPSTNTKAFFGKPLIYF
jgi:hypothetical protein